MLRNYKSIRRKHPDTVTYRAVSKKLRRRDRKSRERTAAKPKDNKSALIYFDESGFTGNNLLNKSQKIFCYASVEFTHEESEKLVNHIIDRYKIQNGEVKGANLIKKSKGKRAIDEIFQSLRGRTKVSISDKKFALAGKFFEYIFEPAISNVNSIFYGINFHRFIANILHVEFTAKGAMAEEIFEDFENLMRTGDFEGLKSLFSSPKNESISPVLELICDFAFYNKESVIEELDGYIDTGSGKWVLDLTNTSLFSLLADWGQKFDELTAYCDQSKPLSEDQSIFNAMLNRKEKLYTTIGGFKSPITFNLKEPLKLVDSKEIHGVQLADAVAAAFAYAFDSENDDEYAIKWRGLFEEVVTEGSIFPDYDYVDLNKIEVQRNAILLQELVERSKKGMSLTDNIGEYLRFITAMLHVSPLEIET